MGRGSSKAGGGGGGGRGTAYNGNPTATDAERKIIDDAKWELDHALYGTSGKMHSYFRKQGGKDLINKLSDDMIEHSLYGWSNQPKQVKEMQDTAKKLLDMAKNSSDLLKDKERVVDRYEALYKELKKIKKDPKAVNKRKK